MSIVQDKRRSPTKRISRTYSLPLGLVQKLEAEAKDKMRGYSNMLELILSERYGEIDEKQIS